MEESQLEISEMERTALRRDEFIIMGGVQGEGGSSLGRNAEELVNQALRSSPNRMQNVTISCYARILCS